MQNNCDRVSVPLKPLLVGFHILASLLGWIQFGTAVGNGEPRMACLAFAVGCYGLALAGVAITANMRVQSHADIALAEIYDLAGWHTDDNACEDDPSPEDMTAHINGLIRRTCREGLGEALVEEGGGPYE